MSSLQYPGGETGRFYRVLSDDGICQIREIINYEMVKSVQQTV